MNPGFLASERTEIRVFVAWGERKV